MAAKEGSLSYCLGDPAADIDGNVSPFLAKAVGSTPDATAYGGTSEEGRPYSTAQ